MFQAPNYREHLSLMLSQVLDDIGVNEEMVTRRREFCMLKEAMNNLTYRLSDGNMTGYYVGSKSEGTTTGGLGSDVDLLIYRHEWNIIQDWSEWEYGKINYLMIEEKMNTSPGYCFLQLLRRYKPLPVTAIPDKRHISDSSGRILLKNTIFNDFIQGSENHGPSNALQGGPRGSDKDLVQAFPCKSWPQSASGWLERQGIGGWPTEAMRKRAVKDYKCCVVATGSKVSKFPELEWRISTSLAERYLMLNLNITQIRCYVLLKMILKSFLNPTAKINISSFMCKTVLLHFIEHKEQSIWENNNLFTCLTDCLSELHTCVQNDSCFHFIIKKNNLMEGQFTAENKHDLSKSITELIQSDGKWLFRIDIDDLGQRLQVKLNMVQHGYHNFHSSLEIHNYLKTLAYINIAGETSDCHKRLLSLLKNKTIMTMEKSVSNLHDLMTSKDNVNRSDHAAITFLAPFIFTTYGSILASSSIGENNKVSPEAQVWLKRGKNSDISSSRLKSASVLYSTGDMEQAEKILREIEHQYDSNPVTPICACCVYDDYASTPELFTVCGEQSEDVIKNITAFCVRFIQIEINCVPHELQYEMFRSTQDDMKDRHQYADFWMDWAVVDSLPFLYFLQYKIFRHLQKHQDQQRALSKLIKTIVTIKNLNHRETALNIYGQCMEQENRPQKALNCYLLSLQLRAKNNVANYHICKLLSRVLAGQ